MNRPTRSHPTLAPLTTLPPSPSYLHSTPSIPTTPSLLSRPSSQTHLHPSSRPTSQTRLRPSRSTPTAIPSSASSPALQNAATQRTKKKKKSSRERRGIRHTDHDVADDYDNNDDDDDWITRTASTLTLTGLEEKGRAWLVARDSSTSLAGGEVGDEDEDEDEDEAGGEGCERGWGSSRARSAKGSWARLHGRERGQSRGQSRAQSRRGSVGGLRGEKEEVGEEEEEEEEEEEGEIGPDFVDVDVEDGEEQGEEVDEGEMRRVVLGRVGGWVDWAVGWMEFRGDGEEEEDAGEDDGGVKGEGGEAVIVRGELDPVELQKRLRKKKRRDDEVETGSEGTDTLSSAPEQAGVWGDAKWLLGVATKVAL